MAVIIKRGTDSNDNKWVIMHVSAIEVTECAKSVTCTILVDDDRLWFELSPPRPVYHLGDVAVCALLFSAMHQSSDLYLPDTLTVSPQLLGQIEQIQTIFVAWYPQQLHKITLHCRSAPAKVSEAGVGCFFSGGVDSCYSAVLNQASISHLVFIHGIDMQLHNQVLMQQVMQENQRMADVLGKPLLVVTSNVRKFCTDRGLSWLIGQGGGLASIAHLLAFEQMLIPASHTDTELFPFGSHPLTDPLFSNEMVALIHDGAVRRSDKIRYLSSHPLIMDRLRVCWQDRGYNCGECEKCLRTMLTLALLNIRSKALPVLTDLQAFKRLRLHGDSEASYVYDSYRLACELNHPSLRAPLKWLIRRIRLRRLLIDLEQTVLGGRLRQWLRQWMQR